MMQPGMVGFAWRGSVDVVPRVCEERPSLRDRGLPHLVVVVDGPALGDADRRYGGLLLPMGESEQRHRVIAGERQIGDAGQEACADDLLGGRGGDGAAKGDQKRIMTPAKAIAAGADHLVVGRPILEAPDPEAAAEAIVAEIAGATR